MLERLTANIATVQHPSTQWILHAGAADAAVSNIQYCTFKNPKIHLHVYNVEYEYKAWRRGMSVYWQLNQTGPTRNF
jgi:hypothetical protein